MDLPFTTQQFFDVFEAYNNAVWPAQPIFIGCAIAAVLSAFAGMRWWPRFAGFLMAALWAWMAFAYHLAFFAQINRAAIAFAALFLVESFLLAFWSARLAVPLDVPPPSRVVAAILFTYAFIGYPALQLAIGHQYPEASTFGLPCPTTIFTFGVFVLLAGSVPLWLFAIPLFWAVVGTVGAVALQIPEDFGLIVAAVSAVAFNLAVRHIRIEPQQPAWTHR